MDTELVWEDPPKKGARTGMARQIAERLRERPGTWAKVLGPTSQSSVESLRAMLNQGGRNGIVAGEFQTRRKKTSAQDDQSYCLWARYIGHEAE